MVHKIRVSPDKLLVIFWQGVFSRDGPIGFTSLITRIDDTIDLLDGKYHFEYIATARGVLSEEYFIHSHMLKRGPKGGLKMIFRGHTAEVALQKEKRLLYMSRQLTFDLDPVVKRQSFTGTRRVTRGMSRPAQMEQGGTSYGVGGQANEDNEEATSNPMDISSSCGLPPRPPQAPGRRASFSYSRDREHRSHWQEMDRLTNEMGEMQIEQGATLNIVQQSAQLIQSI